MATASTTRGGAPTAHRSMDFSFEQLQDAVMNCTDDEITIRDDDEHYSYIIDDEEFSCLEDLYEYLITDETIKQFLEEEAA